MICWLDWAIASGGNTSWMAMDTIATALNILFFRHERTKSYPPLLKFSPGLPSGLQLYPEQAVPAEVSVDR